MKLRNDSPFATLTEDEIDGLVALSSTMTLEEMVKVVAIAPKPIQCSIQAMSRFLRKAKEEKMLRQAEQSEASMEAFAKRAEKPKAREATLGVIRERMFEVAVDSNNRELLMEVFGALNQEKEKERMLELEERKVKAAESNAHAAHRRLELEAAKSGVRLLPKIREMLMDTTRTAEERVSGTLAFMSSEGGRLMIAAASEESALPQVMVAPEPVALPRAAA